MVNNELNGNWSQKFIQIFQWFQNQRKRKEETKRNELKLINGQSKSINTLQSIVSIHTFYCTTIIHDSIWNCPIRELYLASIFGWLPSPEKKKAWYSTKDCDQRLQWIIGILSFQPSSISSCLVSFYLF